MLCCHLAPRLFLAGRGSLHSPQQRQLQQWLAKLQQQQPQAGSAVGRDAWDAGAGLYLSFMEVSPADHWTCFADCWLPETNLPSHDRRSMSRQYDKASSSQTEQSNIIILSC